MFSHTVGQQLIDLKKALDPGAMTRQEYEQERKKILEKQQCVGALSARDYIVSQVL